jgi:hypothetical protein
LDGDELSDPSSGLLTLGETIFYTSGVGGLDSPRVVVKITIHAPVGNLTSVIQPVAKILLTENSRPTLFVLVFTFRRNEVETREGVLFYERCTVAETSRLIPNPNYL